MRRAPFVFLLFVLAGASAQEQATFPQAEISNGQIRAVVYLPNGQTGYYRGSRFDWSGVIPELTYKTHSYFGQWFERYAPTIHDAISGPVDAFDPVGYDNAKPGDLFLKIGVGMITKPDEPKYSFAGPYKIADEGTWDVKIKKDRVIFKHILNRDGYAYEYTKTLALTKGKPELVLEHQLKNTGTKLIETNVYNHNFFVIDKQTTGPDFKVKVPFTLTAGGTETSDVGSLRGDQIVYNRELVKGERLFFNPLEGYGSTSADYDFTIENLKTGAGVRITCDQPLSRLMFWSIYTTLCPEPYTKIKVAPGETTKWTIKYEFYDIKDRK